MTKPWVGAGISLILLLGTALQAQQKPEASGHGVRVCAACIRAHEEFLASDALEGRGSGTRDEEIAATYVAAQLRQYGIAPAGDDGGYMQRAETVRTRLTAPPQISIGDGQAITWNYGKEFIFQFAAGSEFSGPLQKVDSERLAVGKDLPVEAGAVVLVRGTDRKGIRQAAERLFTSGAAAILIPSGDGEEERFAHAAKKLPEMRTRLATDSGSMFPRVSFLEVSQQAVADLEKVPNGTMVKMDAPSTAEKGHTWNAIGMLRGSDARLRKSAILLSAHLDHLGIGPEVNGDSIYNGADDDASGTTAVLELARVLGRGPRPRRTVIFALYGSEEAGGLGSTYFEDHAPAPLAEIAANLEFEMIGRADAMVGADRLWLTGWERSNLGPELAAHGAKLVRDPHPEQNFFMRSDNYVLAKKGVVAQTVSSYGLHQDYHAPSDDLRHLNFAHMDAAIGSLIRPIEWLVNSNFTPRWKPGGRPQGN